MADELNNHESIAPMQSTTTSQSDSHNTTAMFDGWRELMGKDLVMKVRQSAAMESSRTDICVASSAYTLFKMDIHLLVFWGTDTGSRSFCCDVDNDSIASSHSTSRFGVD